jgi:hypothetical protein
LKKHSLLYPILISHYLLLRAFSKAKGHEDVH